MHPKKFSDALKYLGPSYSIKIIDHVETIYRKINENYDIEISGLHNTSTSWKATIFVWKLNPLITVEQIETISLKDLEEHLDQVVVKYRHLD